MRSLPQTPVLLACLLVTASCTELVAQKSFASQFTFATDNDLYLGQGSDGYYTNGILLQFANAIRPRSANTRLRVQSFEAGQQLFTPESRKILLPEQIDRPITGFLYLRYDQSSYTERRIFQWGIRVGLVGKAALGKEMQNAVHKLIGVNANYWGWSWDYQLKNELGADLQLGYAFHLTEPFKGLRLVSESNASLGTMFNQLTQSVVLQLGRYNSLPQSSYWKGGLSREKTAQLPAELYLFYCPGITWQVYNATIQGGMFRKDKGPVTDEVRPFVFQFQLGALYSVRRYHFKVSVVMQGREARYQDSPHAWGSIGAGYRFN